MDISNFINFRNKWLHLVFDVFLLSALSVGLLYIGELIKNQINAPFIIQSPENIRVLVFLLYLILFFIACKTIGRWILNLRNRNRIYKFRSQDWPSNWVFTGRPNSTDSSELVVQSTRAGCLLKNYFWKDFRMTFEMKFMTEHKTIGIVFRAEDLDNYFMLQLSDKHKCIKPHVRYQGGWDVFQPVETDIFGDTGYLNVSLEVKNNTVYLEVKNHLEFTWVLPTHVDVNYRESGVEIKESGTINEDINKGIKIAGHVQDIPFRLGYGKIGFRASPGEGAIIRGLKIKPL